MVGSVPRGISGVCAGTCSRGQGSRGVQGTEQGVALPRKELGKQRGEAERQSCDSALDWGREVIHNPLEDWPSQGAIV